MRSGDFLEDLGRDLGMPRKDMLKVRSDFLKEMGRGLKKKRSSLAMIDSFAVKPTGREKGEFLAVDIGGTNLRVLAIELKGARRHSKPIIKKFPLSRSHIKNDSGVLFGFLAQSIDRFLRSARLPRNSDYRLGFIFSFPVMQRSIDSGLLIKWTKEFSVKDAVGRDVVALFADALCRRGLGNVRISALANDTVGTLVAKSYEDPACDVGIIIGTGTNASYVEKGRLINIEWGNFDKIRMSGFDRELDRISGNRGEQILEKMVSGRYLGEIVRIILLKAAKNKALPGYFSISAISKQWAIRAEDLSAIESDAKNVLKLDGPQREFVKAVCRIVTRRAARIAASALAGVVDRMDKSLSKKHVVAIEGSLYEKHPSFSSDMKAALKEIFGARSSRIRLVLTKDGPGKGAAVLAAAVTS